MLNAISSPATLQTVLAQSTAADKAPPSKQELQVREKFQEFVAGTFYKKMLAALRSGQGKPAYFHGGQMEEVFQQHLDDRLANNMAQQHGDQFAGPLFDAYARRLNTTV